MVLREREALSLLGAWAARGSVPLSTLMLGDCFDRMREIPDASVDMVLCDLPYGTTQNKWDTVLSLERLWAEYWRVCRGAVVLTAADAVRQGARRLVHSPTEIRMDLGERACNGTLER